MLAYIKTYENDKWNIQKDGFWLVLFYHSKKSILLIIRILTSKIVQNCSNDFSTSFNQISGLLSIV
jgi:hypothetical protein